MTIMTEKHDEIKPNTSLIFMKDVTTSIVLLSQMIIKA